MLSPLCAVTENWRPGDHAWKVFPIAGHDFGRGGSEEKKLMGHSSGITSTIAKWKPFLEGGNKELSVWAAPFGQGEILSAATAPPPLHLASWADYDSGAGWAEWRASATSHSSIDNCCGWLLPFTWRGRKKLAVIKIFGVRVWTYEPLIVQCILASVDILHTLLESERETKMSVLNLEMCIIFRGSLLAIYAFAVLMRKKMSKALTNELSKLFYSTVNI